MLVKLHGVRGSRPVHKSNLLGQGGNSTCVQFMIPKKKFELYLDGGSGLAHHGYHLGPDHHCRKYYFMVTHTHWDHMLGYPFFAPLYNPDNEFVFFTSSPKEKDSFHNLFHGLLRKGYLCFPQGTVKARINIELIEPGANFWIENEVNITTYQLNHQGITLGYRVGWNGHSGAVITDNAPIEGGNCLGEGWKEKAKADPQAFERQFDQGLVEFLRDCHTVVFDTHFTEKNLKADWGHSTPHRATKFCSEAGVKRLVLFHHAPEDSDKDVEAKVQSVKDVGAEAGLEVAAAREGDTWTTK